MIDKTVGFALCGSFCTHAKAVEALERVKARFARVVPIVSETVAATDTRFGAAHDLMREVERICDHRVIATVKGAEPIGPQKLLDLLIICPCTGNTPGQAGRRGHRLQRYHGRQGPSAQQPPPWCWPPPPTTGCPPRRGASGSCSTASTSISSPSARTTRRKSPPPWWPTFSLVADAAQAALEGRQLQPILLRG